MSADRQPALIQHATVCAMREIARVGGVLVSPEAAYLMAAAALHAAQEPMQWVATYSLLDALEQAGLGDFVTGFRAELDATVERTLDLPGESI